MKTAALFLLAVACLGAVDDYHAVRFFSKTREAGEAPLVTIRQGKYRETENGEDTRETPKYLIRRSKCHRGGDVSGEVLLTYRDGGLYRGQSRKSPMYVVRGSRIYAGGDDVPLYRVNASALWAVDGDREEPVLTLDGIEDDDEAARAFVWIIALMHLESEASR